LPSVRSVFTYPGETEFTTILLLSSSALSLTVSTSTSESTGNCRRHSHAPDYIVSTITRRPNMLELIARWGHNVLITLTGLLTVIIILWAA
jgi:hypothetical protein